MSSKSLDYPRVVAIGASAGGLQAIQELLENLPVDTGFAFVFISHILRDSVSLLPEILRRSTTMSIVQVLEPIKIRPNVVYLIPPNQFLEIKHGYLLVVPRPLEKVNRAIDHFLFSLAHEDDQRSVGVVLSGEGADGALGLRLLKELGAELTIAQLPDSAASRSMPENAIEIDHVDLVLTPTQIAHRLQQLSRLFDHRADA